VERLVRNIDLLCNNIRNESFDLWYVLRKLYGKSCKELASMTNISTAFAEEEAGSKALFIKVSASDSASNRRLPCAS
jgi:hypothetical protein